MTFMERLERLAEFAVRIRPIGTLFPGGYKATVTTGYDLGKNALKQGVTMSTEVEHPLGTHLKYNKVDPSRSYHGQRRKPYTEIGMVKVPKYKLGSEHLPADEKKKMAYRGTLSGGRSAKSVADLVMPHLAKNGVRIKYDAMPMVKESEAGIHDVERLNRHYVKGAAEYGYRHRSGGLFGQDLLLPSKKQQG
jgi:hypothetical protein